MHSEQPTRLSSVIFAAKAMVHRAKRHVSDLTQPVRRLQHGERGDYPTLLAESRSQLWTAESSVEKTLQFGKVQNLRRACERLNGLLVPSGEIFSFWKQIGKATKRDGYAVGRELREGCLIPTAGGGLCQLSNALYDLVLKCGCEIIERHAHTAVVPGSSSEQGRDATVFWNYVDFRFRPRQSLLIKAVLSRDELIVSFYAKDALVSINEVRTQNLHKNATVNTCTDCSATECFRYVSPVSRQSCRSAFLIEECWSEFEDFIGNKRSSQDELFLPFQSRILRLARYNWDTTDYSKVVFATVGTAMSSVKGRFANGNKPAIALQLAKSEMLARYYGDRLSIDVSYLHVAQTLLPFLWRKGDLGGRSFSVFMTRLPLAILHRQLDHLAATFPDRKSFLEFRAPTWMVESEAEALERADCIVTPHAVLANLYPSKTKRLEWTSPSAKSHRTGKCVIFPGPAVARKGAYEVRNSLRALNHPLLMLNSRASESPHFWNGVDVLQSCEDWLEKAAVVVQPAFIEYNPRPVLRALAAGIPAIATRECGIDNHPLLTLIRAGNSDELTDAIRRITR